MSGGTDKTRIAILGASGYSGAETLRLVRGHPGLAIAVLCADRRAGEDIGAVFPHLAGLGLPRLTRIEAVDWTGIDAVFCCLPHGTTQ